MGESMPTTKDELHRAASPAEARPPRQLHFQLPEAIFSRFFSRLRSALTISRYYWRLADPSDLAPTVSSERTRRGVVKRANYFDQYGGLNP